MGKKHAQHNKKQGPHTSSLFLQTGNLPSSLCVSIRIFNLTSQIDIEWCRLCCFMGYSEIASCCGFPPYWIPCGDLVDRRFLERGFGINQIYIFFSMNLRNLHNTQEARKGWAFWYEILIILFFHSQIFPKILKVFQSTTGILWIVVSLLSACFVSFLVLQSPQNNVPILNNS